VGAGVGVAVATWAAAGRLVVATLIPARLAAKTAIESD
jgi:hypothetical protein